jgi:hypothetical protein
MESLEKRHKNWLKNTQFEELVGDGVKVCDVCKNPVSAGVPMVRLIPYRGAEKIYNHAYNKLHYEYPKEIYECLQIRKGERQNGHI